MHTTVTNTITTAEPPYRPFYPQVSVTLYQELGVTMTLETDLSEPQLCTVLTLALTLDTFSPTCAVTSGGGSGGGGSGGGGSGGTDAKHAQDANWNGKRKTTWLVLERNIVA